MSKQPLRISNQKWQLRLFENWHKCNTNYIVTVSTLNINNGKVKITNTEQGERASTKNFQNYANHKNPALLTYDVITHQIQDHVRIFRYQKNTKGRNCNR